MIKLNLSIEKLFPSKKKFVKSYDYESDKMNYDFINTLESGIFKCLGDGMTFDFIEFDKNYYIDVSIIVSSIELDKKEADDKKVKDVLTFLDSLLKKNLEVNEDKNFLLDYVNIFQESPDGYLITMEDNSGSSKIQISKIIEFFNDSKIKYNLLSNHERRSECGCSGTCTKVLIFFVETIGAGIFYDGIKKLWQKKFSDSVRLSNPRKVDAKKM